MDNRDSVDRSSNEFTPTNTALNSAVSEGGGGESPKGQQSSNAANHMSPAADSVMQSDVNLCSRCTLSSLEADEGNQIGINTLLTRLKQSIASARVTPEAHILSLELALIRV